MSTSLSNAEMRCLQARGWRFMNVDDDTWQWVLYNVETGDVEAEQGDALWHLDVALAQRECLGLSR